MTGASIVIRAYNEAGPLARLLAALAAQRYDGQVEIIVVDNGSTDTTADVARRHGAAVVSLRQDNFSYPGSLNAGIAAARQPIVVCTVAHALPHAASWLAAAVRHFDNPQVAGVYAYPLAATNGTFYDRLLGLGHWRTLPLGPTKIRRVHMGVFGATNLALRRSLWQAHPFDERYGAGGEDTAWAAWALGQGYTLIRDPGFAVRHSHHLRTLKQLRAQYRVWSSLKQPRPFSHDELAFRRSKHQ